MVREIIKYDFSNNTKDSILQKKTEIVKDFNNDLVKECIIDLNDTLDDLINKYGQVRGIGLSAPQIGYSLAISAIQLNEERYIIINPKIIKKSGKTKLFRIGCFSLYQYRGLVKYDEEITIKYYNQFGKENKLEVKDDWALIIQHETDHLEGILLFDKLPNKINDLFIPREKKYITNHVPLKNYGFMMELKRRLGKQKAQTTPQYYSFLFNDSYDYNSYIEKAIIKRKELVDILLRYNNKKNKILEAGCGTSSLSIYLSKLGYKLECVDLDEDMLSLAIRINDRVKGKVNYSKQDITRSNFKNKEFKTIYSHGVLEHLNKDSVLKALKEGFRVADYYIVSVPTIWDISNSLMGDERLSTIRYWKKLFKKQGHKIIEIKKLFLAHKKLEKINNVLKVIPSGNVIFVLKEK